MNVCLHTPAVIYDAAAILLNQNGGIYLLNKDGDYPPSTLNLRDYGSTGLGQITVHADANDDEPLVISHDGEQLREIDCRRLNFVAWTNPPGIELQCAEAGLGLARLDDEAWHTANDVSGNELVIAPASFFAHIFGPHPQVGLGPRSRLSALAIQ